jgi:hypothetical protein
MKPKRHLQKVEDQAAKEKPNKMLLETRLKNVVELVTAAGGAAVTAQAGEFSRAEE